MKNARTLGLYFAILLATIFPGHAAEVEALDALLDRADSVRSSDPQEFQQLLHELDARKEEATRAQSERLAYLHVYLLGIRGNYEDAIRSANDLLSSTDNVEIQARTGAFLVNIYALSKRFTEGLRQLELTLPLLEQVEDQEQREHILGVAAVVHNQAGQYRLGRQYAERILAVTESSRAKCYAGQTRLEAIQNLEDSRLDEADLHDLIRLCSGQAEVVVANLTRAMLARKWAAEGSRNRSIALLRNHLAEAGSSQYPPLIAEFESLLAEYEFEEGNLEVSSHHAESAIEQSRGVEYSQPLVMAYRTQYRIAKAQGDMEAALNRFQDYVAADKAYLNEVKTREMAYQVVHHEALQQSQQIELLNQKNTVLELQQRVSEQRAQNTGLIAVLLTMLLASIAFWAYKTKRVQMRLRRMAEVDMLTGICNRHHFTEKAERTLAQCAKSDEDAVLVMFDLDHFKQVNDRFGHAAGDCALRHVAAACAPLCRPVDCFGRLGGEEFGILLPGCDLAAGKRLAEDCLARFGAIDTTDCGHLFEVTASFGVTTAALSGYDLTRMLSHADKALYRAKRGGRNRVRTYAGDTPASSSAFEALQPIVAGTAAETLGDDKQKRQVALS